MGSVTPLQMEGGEGGTGAASDLLEQVIELLKRRGQKAVYLNTAAGTPRARRFYEKNGFRETGSTSIYQLLGEVPSADVEYVFRIEPCP